MTTISPNDLDQDAQSLNTVVPTIRLKSVNTNRKTIAMLGTGAWGSALATLAAVNDHDLRLWSRRGELSLEEAIADADIIISAISMKGVSDVAEQLKAISLPAKAIIVTATKGLDPKTTRTPSQIWQETFPDHPVVVLSGRTSRRKLKLVCPPRR